MPWHTWRQSSRARHAAPFPVHTKGGGQTDGRTDCREMLAFCYWGEAKELLLLG